MRWVEDSHDRMGVRLLRGHGVYTPFAVRLGWDHGPVSYW